MVWYTGCAMQRWFKASHPEMASILEVCTSTSVQRPVSSSLNKFVVTSSLLPSHPKICQPGHDDASSFLSLSLLRDAWLSMCCSHTTSSNNGVEGHVEAFCRRRYSWHSNPLSMMAIMKAWVVEHLFPRIAMIGPRETGSQIRLRQSSFFERLPPRSW